MLELESSARSGSAVRRACLSSSWACAAASHRAGRGITAARAAIFASGRRLLPHGFNLWCGGASVCVCRRCAGSGRVFGDIEMCGHRTAYALPVRRGVEPHLWHDAILKEIAILRCPDPKNFLASQGRTVTDHELASVTRPPEPKGEIGVLPLDLRIRLGSKKSAI